MLSGTVPPEELATGAPTMESLTADPVTLTGVEVLQAAFELPYRARGSTLPPGLHPTTPPLMVVLAWAAPDSPWGPFTMAQVRVSCRSGVRPRGLVTGCLVDNPAACAALRSDRGLPAAPGEVRLRRGYDAVGLRAAPAGAEAGSVALDLVGPDPDPLGAGDVQYTVTVTLAHTPRGIRLVQLEPEYEVRRVERVRPRLCSFDTSAWGPVGLEPGRPVSATVAVADITIPKLRFVSRPDVTAFEGTESL